MRHIKIILSCWVLCLCFPAFADGVVYEVSKGKQRLYLGGTIHLLRPSDFPLPQEYEKAYQSSQKIVFETDLEKAQSPEFGQRFAQAMILPNQQTLRDILEPETWAALQAYANQSQYPLSQTMMYSPAMHSMLIVLAESKKVGVGDGVDAFYYKKAREDKKIVDELESADMVITYMQGLNQEDPNQTIKNTLKDINELPTTLADMIAAWKKGDLNSLQKNMGEKLKEESVLAYNLLVVKRNQNWLPQIEAMLKTPETEFILVGSLHLSGPDGLLIALKKDGYKVRSIAF